MCEQLKSLKCHLTPEALAVFTNVSFMLFVVAKKLQKIQSTKSYHQLYYNYNYINLPFWGRIETDFCFPSQEVTGRTAVPGKFLSRTNTHQLEVSVVLLAATDRERDDDGLLKSVCQQSLSNTWGATSVISSDHQCTTIITGEKLRDFKLWQAWKVKCYMLHVRFALLCWCSLLIWNHSAN